MSKPMLLKNLNDVRELMLKEVDLDRENRKIYVSGRMTDPGKERFIVALQQAMHGYDNVWLAEALSPREFWHEYELRSHMTQGTTEVRVPVNAPDVLADNQFNRYYMRGVCLKAIELGHDKVVIYRARESSRKREEHEALIGSALDPVKTLEELRDGTSELASIGSNYGLSLALPQ